MQDVYEVQARPWHGPGFSKSERAMATYLGLEVINVRRRSGGDFDVEIDYIAADQHAETAWMPLVFLHQEWRRRPYEIGGLAEAAGARQASDCAKDWDHIRDLDDQEKFLVMCVGAWKLILLRTAAVPPTTRDQ